MLKTSDIQRFLVAGSTLHDSIWNKNQENVGGEKTEGHVDRIRFYPSMIQTNRRDGMVIEKDFLDVQTHVSPNDDIMDDLDPACCGTDAGSYEADGNKLHL